MKKTILLTLALQFLFVTLDKLKDQVSCLLQYNQNTFENLQDKSK